MSKGVIQHRKRALQINDFSGLVRHRGITPTDLDGCLDYRGSAFLFMEGKFQDAPTPIGQKRFLENLCNAVLDGGKFACAIIYTHNAPSSKDVNVASSIVKEVFWDRAWGLEGGRTVKQFISSYEAYLLNIGLRI